MKIVVVEDQTMIRDLLVWACRSTFSPKSIGQASDAAGALRRWSTEKKDYVIPVDEWTIRAGASSADIRQTAAVKL